ncbi:MAG: diguanylate cyclase [Candidatus Omnitrophica bacterium]|nr:diguanylate cyclase [Candidatus Omnitrophota bacterium]
MLKQKKSFLSSGNLKYKLRIAFCLMSVLPLLVSMYLVSNYILPKAGFRLDASVAVSVVISIAIAVIGFFLVKEVFDRVVSISSEAKLIAAGDFNRMVETSKEDEVGYLGESLNQLTVQIRNSMDELKGYSERTTEINVEIQKRVLALSSLLQISSLISQGLKLDEILQLTVEKSRILANSDVTFLFFRDAEEGDFYVRAVDGINAQHMAKLKIEQNEPVFGKLVKTNKPLIVDKDNTLAENSRIAFYEKFRLKNILALPIFLRGKVTGILGIGNTKEPFLYKKEDVELLDIFAKQITIAVENDLLLRWVEKLEIKDALTGLYNEAFIKNRLQEEIRRAIIYQRPCSFIILNIDNFAAYHQNFGSLQAESTLKRVASLVRDSITEIDRAARIGDNEFALVLPEKNKRQSQAIAEDIRKKIEFVFGEEQDQNKKITVSGSVSENPLDGLTAEELFLKAKELLVKAKSQGKNKIVI